ncbi:hypothetical protein ACET3Z_006085 [Daucus carota]
MLAKLLNLPILPDSNRLHVFGTIILINNEENASSRFGIRLHTFKRHRSLFYFHHTGSAALPVRCGC